MRPIYLTTRPDLGDVSHGQLVTIEMAALLLSVRAQGWSDTIFESEGASGRKKREGAAQITGISWADLLRQYGHAHARLELKAVARRFARSYE